MSFNFDAINESIGDQVTLKENDLRSFVETMDPNSSNDMLIFQQKIQEWELTVDLQATVTKSLKDTLSSVIQKMQ